jgi:hypothetical protein
MQFSCIFRSHKGSDYDFDAGKFPVSGVITCNLGNCIDMLLAMPQAFMRTTLTAGNVLLSNRLLHPAEAGFSKDKTSRNALPANN